MQYKVFTSLPGVAHHGISTEIEELRKFEDFINIMIIEGFRSIGGISIRPGAHSGCYFIQAMIKGD